MSDVATIDRARPRANVFQVTVDAAGVVIIRRKLRRADVLRFFSSQPPCIVGMEACATSHYWAREIGRLGHDVRMMAPAYVKSYVKRGKSDGEEDRGRSAAA